MPPTKNKRIVLTEMFKGFDSFVEDAVSKEELKEALDTVADFIKQMKVAVEEKTAENKAEIGKAIETLREFVGTARGEMDTKLSSDLGALTAKLDNKEKELRTLISEVEEMIAYYDDSEVRGLIEEVKSQIPEMPESFDPSEIIEDIEELEKKYKDLEARLGKVGGTVGGVSDMRIRQAFKYILRTEQPAGLINGSNTVYTVSQPIFAVLAFSLNGEVIAQLPNYTISGKTITFSSALPSAYSGKDFEIKYV